MDVETNLQRLVVEEGSSLQAEYRGRMLGRSVTLGPLFIPPHSEGTIVNANVPWSFKGSRILIPKLPNRDIGNFFEITDFQIGDVSQFGYMASPMKIPAWIFTMDEAPFVAYKLDTAGPDKPISMTVRNITDQPHSFMAFIEE